MQQEFNPVCYFAGGISTHPTFAKASVDKPCTSPWRRGKCINYMKFLVAGLGNIGPEYELTRHNIGFLTLDRLADNHKIDFTTERLADKAELKFKGKHIHLIKPNTYMNLSGKAIAYWLQELKIPKENLLVVLDDIALPFGSLRLRQKGSSAGHNGLKNIELMLGGQDYSRLRMGIGSDFSKGKQIDFVLSKFEKDEFDVLPAVMDKSIEMILSFCAIGVERTMNFFNKAKDGK